MGWKRVCGSADLTENALKTFNVDGISILLVNYGDGMRAIPPICPHMEEPLVDSAFVSRCVLTCTKHLWAWNLRTLEMLDDRQKPLKTYEVKEENGAVFVLIDQELLYDFEEEAADEFDDFFTRS
jgi:toluene monooxygenase system ferredoxin subunit